MRNSKILARFRAGQPARLAMMGYFLPPFVAYAAHLGFDGVWVDTEHHNFDDREIQALLAFFHLYDIDCVLRVATREKARLYRYLEDGATGLIVPHVNDVQAVRDLVQSVKFPPIGDRGLQGRGLEANFGLDDRYALVDHARNETFLIVQIETPQALAQAEEMASVPGIDGLYIGPSDLGLRLMQQPEHQRITVEAAIEQVGAICKIHNKLWGSLPRTVDEVKQHAALGSNFLVWGIDARILQEGLTVARKVLDEVLQ
jgi:2-keto-3-deoxy-L-rhamnonate aldolase RhmA